MKWTLLILLGVTAFGFERGVYADQQALLSRGDMVVYRYRTPKRSKHFYRSWLVLQEYPESGHLDLREVEFDSEKNIRTSREWRTDAERMLAERLRELEGCQVWERLRFLDIEEIEACRVELFYERANEVGRQVVVSETRWYSRVVPFLLVRSEKRVEGRLVEVVEVAHRVERN